MTSTPPSDSQPVSGATRTLVIGADRFIYWFARHWVAVFNVIAAIYVGLPILAPVLIQAGLRGPAAVIYTLYKPMCHQMAFRSFFLYGEQYAYPREIAGTELTPIEAYVNDIPEFAGASANDTNRFFLAARAFLGNAEMGFKMALCERDIAIYGFILMGGLLYGLLHRRMEIRPLSVLAFVLLGMVPIGLDGFSQLFSYSFQSLGALGTAVGDFFQNLLPLRESTPLLRVLTGGWFGLCLVWLAYPNIDRGMRETERELGGKLRRAEIIS